MQSACCTNYEATVQNQLKCLVPVVSETDHCVTPCRTLLRLLMYIRPGLHMFAAIGCNWPVSMA